MATERSRTPFLASRGKQAPHTDSPDEDEPISPALLRELKRRMKDFRDPTRYAVVSVFGPRFLLYYDACGDNYPMNDLSHATLFKRPAVARAVMSALGGGHAIMTVRLMKDGRIKRVTPLKELVSEAERKRGARRRAPNPSLQRTRFARR